MRSLLTIGSHISLSGSAFVRSAPGRALLLGAVLPSIRHFVSRPQGPRPLYALRALWRAPAARFNSTIPPPPPPPSHADKDAKGKLILNRLSRAFTFLISTVMVVGALGVALLVVYLILSELFLPLGDTRTFNKAVKLVEHNEEAQRLLEFGPGERLKAYGETFGDKWVRNRPAQSVRTKGADGKDHMLMRFHVESDAGKHGTVILEQVDQLFWEADFSYVALDTLGNKRVYVVEPKFARRPKVGGSEGGFLGLKWGPKKD